MFKKTIFFSLLFLFLITTLSFAEKIQLKSGEIVEGTIVERSADYIRMDTGLGVNVTYYFDEISTIDGNSPEKKKEENQELPQAEHPTENVTVEPSANVVMPEQSSDVNNQNEVQETVSNSVENTAPETGRAASSKGKGLEDYLLEEAKSTQEQSRPKWQGNYLEYQVDIQKKDIKEKVVLVKNVLLETVKEKVQDFRKKKPKVYNQIVSIITTVKSIPLSLWILMAMAYYILFCYPLMLIAQKLGIKHSWMAWIPIAQLFLMTRMAGKSFGSFLLLFVTPFNIFVFMGLWGEICGFLQKSTFLGILMILPGFNLIIIWYLALAKTK
ncbi:MAG: hypothetical protein HQL24_07900 [Candidatus Omnitrophica bacterium]|nr:hypothetical protein [Candidatus Omnitrophota bacterium]